jgi:peptide/nickel transport system permease protein
VQYWIFLKGLVLHFDLGYSYQNSVSVKSQIFTRLPVTLSLTAGAFVIWMLAAIPIGVISAIRPRSLLDRATMGAALVAISAPVYFLGLIALFLFSNDIGVVHLLPGAGTYAPISVSPWHWFTSLLMPWCVLAAAFAAFYARMVRGNLIDTLGEDYIRTARAKGLSERRVVMRHGLRAALTPVVTMAGLDIGILLGGAILTETVFNIPGIGRLAYDSIQNSDLPMIQGTVLLGAFFIILANLVVDILYAFVDPRVRY